MGNQNSTSSDGGLVLYLTGSKVGGRWRTLGESGTTTLEEFVTQVFKAHKDMQSVEDLAGILDTDTYTRREASFRSGSGIETYKAAYSRYNEIRVLGYLDYGIYRLVFVELRDRNGGYLNATPVMPVISTLNGLRLSDSPGATEGGDPVFNLFLGGKFHDEVVKQLSDQ